MQRPTAENFGRRYFLGDLSEQDRLQAEDAYLADPGVFEHFVAAEGELIDQYVRGELSEVEEQKFELDYLTTPERREKLEFARALKQICEVEEAASRAETLSLWRKILSGLSNSTETPRWVLAAAALMIVAVGSWLIVRDVRLRAELHQALANQVDLRREEDTLRQHVVDLERSHEDAVRQDHFDTEIATLGAAREHEIPLRLFPGITRGPAGQQNTFTLRPKTASLQLQLFLDQNEYLTYEAVLLAADGKEVLRTAALHGRPTNGSTILAWHLPANTIGTGDYVVKVKGRTSGGNLEDVGSYSFRLEP